MEKNEINENNKMNETNNTNEMIDNEFIRKIDLKSDKMIMFAPAQLAYAGDAVYELLVRSYIINHHDINVNKMHKHAVKFVKAQAQSHFIKELYPILSEEEIRIVKRGRNAKVTSSPKNVDLVEYRYATGFETLFGYLYLNNELDRLMELFNKIIEIANNTDDENKLINSKKKNKSNNNNVNNANNNTNILNNHSNPSNINNLNNSNKPEEKSI